MKARPRAAEIPPAIDELLAAGQRRVGEGRLSLRDLKPAGLKNGRAQSIPEFRLLRRSALICPINLITPRSNEGIRSARQKLCSPVV
jgi:hypothetical protein